MRNETSVLVLITTFFILNVMLVNLLIAQMSGTFQRIKDAADLPRVRERWELAEEYMRPALSAPPLIQMIVMAYNAWLYYGRDQRKLVKERWPDLGWHQRIDLFLSINCDLKPEDSKEKQEQEMQEKKKNMTDRREKEKYDRLNLNTLKELARKDYLDSKDEKSEAGGMDQAVLESRIRRLERLQDENLESMKKHMTEEFEKRLESMKEHMTVEFETRMPSQKRMPSQAQDLQHLNSMKEGEDKLLKLIEQRFERLELMTQLAQGVNGDESASKPNPTGNESATKLINNSLPKWPSFMEGPSSALSIIKFGLEIQNVHRRNL